LPIDEPGPETPGDSDDVSLSLNNEIAGRLEEAAALLDQQGANPFRVRAYHRAAETLRRLKEPVTAILAVEGVDGLERLPAIGVRFACAIRDMVYLGYLPLLERLRGESDPVRLLQSVPGIGPRLAARLHEELGLSTLEDLEAAAHDGRLESIAGFGRKRLAGVRDVLAHRLERVRPSPTREGPQPGVGELLDIDREYRESAAAGLLPTIAPRRFNPGALRWLPILHTSRRERHYTALFSNTARAHRLKKTDDWVVIYRDHDVGDGQWTVVTGTHGALAGRRVVRGREDECTRHYGLAA
jgi:DNA polymerase (family 10)